MIWTHCTESLCKARQFGAWLGAMWRELMSSLALALLLATGAVAEESVQTPSVDEAREREKLARDLADLAERARPPQGAPIPGMQCAPHDEMVKALKAQYGEGPVEWGLHPDGLFLIELYRTPDGSTWTLVTTTAQTGRSCLSGAGKHWTMGSAALMPGQPS